MYEYIKGIYAGINKDYIIVENGGIGYKVFTSGSTMAKMPKLDEPVKLYLQQIVREDFIGLYGFLTKDEIGVFNLLLTINGVGAKATLSLMSISSVENLKYAIVSGDEKTLIKAPGIGKKIAQRIILELKDKIKTSQVDGNNIGLSAEREENDKCTEALEALLSLGYSEKEAKEALKNTNKSETIENIIKDCLRNLMN